MSVEFLFANMALKIFGALISYGFIAAILIYLKVVPARTMFLGVLPLALLFVVWSSWQKAGPRFVLTDTVQQAPEYIGGEIKTSGREKMTDAERLQYNQELIQSNKRTE